MDNLKDLGIPGWIAGYNGKPALVTKSGSLYRGDDYLEVSMNTFRFAFITRKGVNFLMPTIPKMDLHVALTLEGRGNEELPEQTLMACRIKGLDLKGMASDALPSLPDAPVDVA